MIRELEHSASATTQVEKSRVCFNYSLPFWTPDHWWIGIKPADLIFLYSIQASRTFTNSSVGNYVEGNVSGGQHNRNSGQLNYGSITTQNNYYSRGDRDDGKASGAENDKVRHGGDSTRQWWTQGHCLNLYYKRKRKRIFGLTITIYMTDEASAFSQ